jgi:hypothetical protein
MAGTPAAFGRPSRERAVYKPVSGRAKTVIGVDHARHGRCQAAISNPSRVSGARRRLDLAAHTTPFNTHTARSGRSNSEHRAALVERACDPLPLDRACSFRCVEHGASEHLAAIGLIATPLQWLHTNALAAYNIAFVLSFALSGLFTFLLIRRLVVRLTIPDVTRGMRVHPVAPWLRRELRVFGPK